MKAFKHSILLAIVLSIAAFTAAQDVGITQMIYPESGQNIHIQYSYEFIIQVRNEGGSPVIYDSISFDLLIDKQFYQNYPMPGPTGTLGIGESIEVTLPALTLSSIDPFLEVCIATVLGGDNNANNDTVCNVLLFSTNSFVDLKPVLVRIVEPLYSDSIIDPGTSITRMESYIKNVGDVTLPKNYNVLLQFKMYTKSRNFFGTTTGAFDIGDNYIMSMKGGIPDVQEDNGPFTVCLTIRNLDDLNASNNEFCQVFYALDFTGIDQNEKDKYASYAYGEGLNLIHPNQSGENLIQIHSVTGKLMHTSMSNADSKKEYIDISHFNSGVYIINVTDSSGNLLHSNKFTID